ncbi:MAG: biotin--[acetyl-CoA-carboxylase] ligase [Candidatus Omnitrophica bacterium]|nr:biotin--[acetyl-CoA-carboxylase] ligase [Candidatus Omnitrophota bacterium]
MIEAKIIKLLKENKNSYISGEELSRKLNVSRTAIWKHITHLRACGYEISASPHTGYSLDRVPDKLLPDEISYGLETKVLGKKIYAYNSADSTNIIAYNLAEQSEAEGALIVAEKQTKGKGRMGRHWVSPPGSGIYMSLILKPKISPAEAGKITLMSSVAVAKTIRKTTKIKAEIKWPNDVYIADAKVCGILTEMSAEMDMINFIIMGIGININTPKSSLPDMATSLFIETKQKVNRVTFLQAMLWEIETYYNKLVKGSFSDIINDWRDLSLTLGKRIKVEWRGKLIQGQAMDIDDSGALIVRDDFGFSHHILSGDVSVIS